MPYCCIPGCRSNNKLFNTPNSPNDNILRLHRFDLNSLLSKPKSKSQYICCIHFKNADFYIQKGKKILSENAVPRLFLPLYMSKIIGENVPEKIQINANALQDENNVDINEQDTDDKTEIQDFINHEHNFIPPTEDQKIDENSHMEFLVVDMEKFIEHKENICRVCGLETNFINLAQPNHQSYVHKFLSCANVTFEIDDKLPKYLCEYCKIELENSYQFKEKCEESQKNFQQLLIASGASEAAAVQLNENDLNIKAEKNDEKLDDICQIDDNFIDDVNNENAKKDEIITTVEKNRKRKYKLQTRDIDDDLDFEELDLFKITSESETIFVCDICKREYPKKLYLESHMKKKHKMARNLCQCQYCGVYVKGSLYKTHIYSHEKPFKCKICSMTFVSHDRGLIHVKNLHSQHPKPGEYGEFIICNSKETTTTTNFTCDICNRVFLLKYNLEIHMQKEHKMAKNLCECKYCGDYFSSTSFKNHIYSHQKPKCNICLKTFSSIGNLSHHIAIVHSKRPKLIRELRNEEMRAKNYLAIHIKPKCDICLKIFSSKSNLTAHVARKHSKIPKLPRKRKNSNKNEKEFKCENCSASFKLESGLDRHNKIRHNIIKEETTDQEPKINKPVIRICQICGKVCTNSYFYYHMTTHSDKKKYKCKFCDKCFKYHNQFKNHVRMHTGEKPYKCEVCSMGFRQSAHLATHRRMHTMQKPYKCYYCDKTFAQSGNRTKHVRVHTGEKPFQCKFCKENFTESNILKKHVLKYHQ